MHVAYLIVWGPVLFAVAVGLGKARVRAQRRSAEQAGRWVDAWAQRHPEVRRLMLRRGCDRRTLGVLAMSDWRERVAGDATAAVADLFDDGGTANGYRPAETQHSYS